MITPTRVWRARCPWAFVCVMILMSGCKPEITSFTPTRGAAGDPVTIYGENFRTDASKDTLWFGTERAEITAPPTETMIKTKVPAGAKTGVIIIKTDRGTGTSPTDFIVPSAKKWTILVYLDADNNLESDGLDDFMEMASVGSGPAVNIVVQMDRTPGHSTEYGDWTDTRRFLIQSSSTPASAPVQILGEKNMGDPAVLQDFVTWGVSTYPAEHYLLVIWNHGGGWRALQERMAAMRAGPGTTTEPLFKDVAYDDTNNDFLYMHEVEQALMAAKADIGTRMATFVKLDVVGFDACLMGMVEVAYALRDCANLMVGSEELEPGAGWPYNTALADLVSRPTMSPKDLCATIVAKYVASYSSNANVTLAAHDLSRIGAVASAIDAFTGVATSEWDRIKSARTNTHQYHPQGYTRFWGADLRQFAENVANGVGGATLKSAALAMRDAVAQCVVAESHGQPASGSNGLAIYFPPGKGSFDSDPDHTAYAQTNAVMPVDFVQHHFWDEWLLTYYQNTANIP